MPISGRCISSWRPSRLNGTTPCGSHHNNLPLCQRIPHILLPNHAASTDNQPPRPVTYPYRGYYLVLNHRSISRLRQSRLYLRQSANVTPPTPIDLNLTRARTRPSTPDDSLVDTDDDNNDTSPPHHNTKRRRPIKQDTTDDAVNDNITNKIRKKDDEIKYPTHYECDQDISILTSKDSIRHMLQGLH